MVIVLFGHLPQGDSAKSTGSCGADGDGGRDRGNPCPAQRNVYGIVLIGCVMHYRQGSEGLLRTPSARIETTIDFDWPGVEIEAFASGNDRERSREGSHTLSV